MDTTTTDGGGYRLKAGATRACAPAVRVLADAGISANVVTAAGLVTAFGLGAVVLAGAHVDGRWWLAAAPLAALRLGLAVADGQLARATGTADDRGALLGELADRLGDVLVLGGLTALAPLAGGLAVIAALAADTLPALTWAITGDRRFPGVGGKPDRTLLVGLGLPLGLAIPPLVPLLPWLVVVLVVANLGLRLRAAVRVVG